GNSPQKEAGRFACPSFDPDSITSTDSHIPPLRACENSAHGRLNTSKSGTIVMTATNRLAAGGCDYIHGFADVLG
ncbi:hypothetical protein, partial [Acinetobacter baumannii]|uniref:hypothetical protein n=1 Tax=Acinetobacter baumannii TaxID=470 RepID=UPI001BB46978